jgi:hypothetical protein
MSNFGGSNMFGKLKSGKGFLGNVGNMFRTDASEVLNLVWVKWH